jgi:hypothetical protein
MVSTAGTLPRKVVRSSKPPSRASRSASERSGPSPIKIRRAGISLRIASKIARTSGIRLTGRKFETCTIRTSPSRASARANGEAPSGRYCRVSTKLGTTSIVRATPNSRFVTSRRYFETAVTASLFSIPQRVIGRYERS